jgi:DNA-binding MarR family transcriptional regulator
MRRLTIPAITLAMTLAPAVLTAQTPEQRGPRGPFGGAPVERIIQQREQLGLTDQQVTELRRIQTELQEKNRPLIAQIQAARPAVTPEQREQMRQRRQQPGARAALPDSMRQRMQQMTPEQRAQMRERMQQMTPEQREQMREGMRQRPGRPATAMPRSMPAELQPVMQQVRENTQEAARRVQAALTEEQRAKLRELRPARMQQRTR